MSVDFVIEFRNLHKLSICATPMSLHTSQVGNLAPAKHAEPCLA